MIGNHYYLYLVKIEYQILIKTCIYGASSYIWDLIRLKISLVRDLLLADGSIHLKFKLTSTFLNTDLDLFKCCHNLKNPPTCVVSMSKIVSHDSPLVMSNILLGFWRVGIWNILQFQDYEIWVIFMVKFKEALDVNFCINI